MATTTPPAGAKKLPAAVCPMPKARSKLWRHSAIRKMITELHISTDSAKLLADRAEAIAEEKGERAKKAISELKEKLCALSGKQEHSLYKLLCSGKKSPMLDLLTAQQFTVAEKGKE